jgi:predicted ATPase
VGGLLMPEKSPLIQSIKLQNFLSFGPESQEITLRPLNLLIGPNGSGKSNLIEAIDMMRSTPVDLPDSIRKKGGISEFIWKGSSNPLVAEIELSLFIEDLIFGFPSIVKHRIGFSEIFDRYFNLESESIEAQESGNGQGQYYYRNQEGRPLILAYSNDQHKHEPIDINDKSWAPHQSILKQRRDPRYPRLIDISNEYQRIFIYRDLNMGKDSLTRKAPKMDYKSDFLDEDAYNLALVLNHLENTIVWERILEYLQKFYEPTHRITTKIESGSVQIYLHEKGLNRPVPATRFSDGFLRFLCLLTILIQPNPPPLICIEEPELGLHPDSLPIVAELLREASKRTQLIVTTHSDLLVDAFSDEPESVMVCEKEDDSTTMRRLDREALSEWLNKYALGELWRMGEIGGKRW